MPAPPREQPSFLRAIDRSSPRPTDSSSWRNSGFGRSSQNNETPVVIRPEERGFLRSIDPSTPSTTASSSNSGFGRRSGGTRRKKGKSKKARKSKK